MKKPAIVSAVALVVIVLAGGGLLLAKHHSNNQKAATAARNQAQIQQLRDQQSAMNSSMKMSPSTTEGHDGAGLGDPNDNSTSNAIDIKNFAYTPAHTTVKVGTTVTWTNQDSAAHTVTTSDGPEVLDSGSIAQGQTFSHTFTKAGDYKYYCKFHSSMSSATITVTE